MGWGSGHWVGALMLGDGKGWGTGSVRALSPTPTQGMLADTCSQNAQSSLLQAAYSKGRMP